MRPSQRQGRIFTAQGRAAVKVDEARRRADKQSAELQSEGRRGLGPRQQRLEADPGRLERARCAVRQRIDQKKAELDRNEAELDAEYAESDAADAIDFAAASIEEAQYAVLDAILTRADADALAATV